MIFTRPATIEDAQMLLDLKNDHTMRKYSIEGKNIVSMADHLKWLERNLKHITIIKDTENDIGDVRIKDGFIHIKLFPEYRGKGYGTEAIMRYRSPGMMTQVVGTNIPSLRMFIKCGFKLIKYGMRRDTFYYILRYEGDTFGLQRKQTNYLG